MPPGLPLNGKQLQRVPADASRDIQISVINEIIDTLNNVSKDVVLSGTTTFNVDGTGIQVIPVPHGLGYSPRVEAYLNDTTITDSDGNSYPNVNLSLPTPLETTDAAGVVGFNVQMDFFVDTQNLYFRILNANGGTGSGFLVTWALSRLAAS